MSKSMTGICACGCGEPVGGNSIYSGNDDNERAPHRVRAFRNRQDAGEAQQQALQVRQEALAELGLEAAALPELMASLNIFVTSVGHISAAVTDRAADCDEQTVERRIREAREDDRAVLDTLRSELAATQQTLDKTRDDNRRLRDLAAAAEVDAAELSELLMLQKDELEVLARELSTTLAQRDDAQQQLAGAQTALGHMTQLLHQQHALIGTHYPPDHDGAAPGTT